MTQAFLPLAANYYMVLTDDSSLFELAISDTNSIGSVWQISNLDVANVAFVHISTEQFDSSAIVPAEGIPGTGTAIPPGQSVYIQFNSAGAADGPVYVSGAVTGTAEIVLVPGSFV